MLQFETSILINAPVDLVWKFHERPDLEEILTPPWQPVTVINQKTGLAIGGSIEFRILLGLIPVTWIAEYIELKKPYFFVDIQSVGPLKSWRHEHHLKPVENKTRLIDIIYYELPGGKSSECVLKWWVNSRLADMFKYRHQVTKNICEFQNNANLTNMYGQLPIDLFLEKSTKILYN